MKINRNTIIISVILVLIIIAVILIILMFNNNSPKNIDMDELYLKLVDEGNFNEQQSQKIDIDNLTEIFKIDKLKVQEVIGLIPIINVKSSMFIVVKTLSGEEKNIEENLNEYALKYEQEWSTYFEDQYKLVKDRKIGHKGNYVYLIISDIPQNLVDLIK